MHIALVGMSNVGKSGWAARLSAEAGFEAVECDELIAQKLAPELTEGGTKGMAEWMGQPFDPRYRDASRRYLDLEKAVMRHVMQKLRTTTKPHVIDTTGSVIYTGDDILAELRSVACVVYFEIPPGAAERFFERYTREPKPVIWGDLYTPSPGETPQETLKRCYPLLLESRAKKYKALAHVTIPFEWQNRPEASVTALLDYIQVTPR